MVKTYTQLKGALISGCNRLKSGRSRTWYSVKATGRVRQNKMGYNLTEVIDPKADYKTRWLNMRSLSGRIILTSDDMQIWENGNKKRTLTNEGMYKRNIIGHSIELLKNYFNVPEEQLPAILKSKSETEIDELILKCQEVAH